MLQNISPVISNLLHFQPKLKKLVLPTLLIAVFVPVQAVSDSLLWRIQKQDIAPSYLFGTIHLDDKRVLRLSKKVQRAFDYSTVILTEVTLNLEVMQEIQNTFLRANKTRLRDDLGKKRYAELYKLLSQRKLVDAYIDRLKVWAAMMLLLMPDSSGVILDVKLQQLAATEGKQLQGLETVASQLGRFDKLPLQDQIQMLDEAMAIEPKLKELYEEITKAYLAEDLSKLYKLSQVGYGTNKLNDKLQALLIDDRNRDMLQAALPHINNGNAFIAVGALHLPGEQGLIKLMRQQGYQVEPVR